MEAAAAAKTAAAATAAATATEDWRWRCCSGSPSNSNTISSCKGNHNQSERRRQAHACQFVPIQTALLKLSPQLPAHAPHRQHRQNAATEFYPPGVWWHIVGCPTRSATEHRGGQTSTLAAGAAAAAAAAVAAALVVLLLALAATHHELAFVRPLSMHNAILPLTRNCCGILFCCSCCCQQRQWKGPDAKAAASGEFVPPVWWQTVRMPSTVCHRTPGDKIHHWRWFWQRGPSTGVAASRRSSRRRSHSSSS